MPSMDTSGITVSGFANGCEQNVQSTYVGFVLSSGQKHGGSANSFSASQSSSSVTAPVKSGNKLHVSSKPIVATASNPGIVTISFGFVKAALPSHNVQVVAVVVGRDSLVFSRWYF